MSKLEKIMEDLRQKVARQNLNAQTYGYHSSEFQICRMILNTTLETLEEVEYIDSYTFAYTGEKGVISRLYIYYRMYSVTITEKEVVYE